MKRTISRVSLLAALLALVAIALPAQAQSGNGYDLSWWTVDGGGATFSTGGEYSLGGTAGQPDAALWAGGEYTLVGGFWGGLAIEYLVYLPVALKNQ